jgi:protein-tyrosine phosphatase
MPEDERVQPYRVTVVCSGNICRSPIAEVVLRQAVEDAGLGHAVVVDSAGIGGWHAGDPADRRTRAVLRRHGYDGDAHRAQQITARWFDREDAPRLLLAMDTTHYDDLVRLAPDAEVVMMRAFDPALADVPHPSDELDVPDPYYGGDDGFEDVLAMIEAATPGTLAHIRTRMKASPS